MKRIFFLSMGLTLLLTACMAGAPAESEAASAAAQTPAPEAAIPSGTPGPDHAVPAQTPEPAKPTEEQGGNTVTISINGRVFYATLYDNETAAALQARLPLTLNMSELNGNEKYNYLSFHLPTDAGNPGQIHTGDLMLYGSNCLVLFYESFSTGYRYTPIGRVSDPSGLADAVGDGDVQITFAAE